MPTDPLPSPTDPPMTAEEWRQAYFVALAIAQSEIDRLRKALWKLENDAISVVYAARQTLDPRESPDNWPPHRRTPSND